MTREQAWQLLSEYNKEPFHLKHAVTLEGCMRWFANSLGFAEEADTWALVGLLHDLDFEQFPDQHCKKSQEIMREAGIEPKRMTMVSADKGSAPSLVLVMGKRGGKPDLTLTEPLYMYADSEHRINSPEVDYILENGRFPDRFYIK